MYSNILERYELAQTIMQGFNSNSLLMNDAVFPHWIKGSDCFWYERDTRNGRDFYLVNASTKTRTPAFDHKNLASELTKKTEKEIDPLNLPIENVHMSLEPFRIRFQCLDMHWVFDVDSGYCEKVEVEIEDAGINSPDGKKIVFTRENNLWIRDKLSGEEVALTIDGTNDYSYGSTFFHIDPNVQAIWSPDSTKIFAVQLDLREVADRPQISYSPLDGSLPSQLHQFRMAYPGDEHVESYRLVVIDVSTGILRAADYPNLPHVLHGLEIDGFFTGGLGWWSTDSVHAFFVDVARGSKAIRVVKWNTHSGEIQVLFEENSNTYLRICEDMLSSPIFRSLPESNELIWFSERSGYAHLYLYDQNSGELKNPITQGQWLVRSILHFDAERRELLIQTAARDSDISPYYRDICKVNIDSGELEVLKSGCFDHMVYYPKHTCVLIRTQLGVNSAADVCGLSPCGRYIVTTYSRVDTPPVSVLINRNGNEILELETADISGLPTGWNWPEPVKLKAADDQTDIYGVVFRPPDFSPDKSYPVVDFIVGMRLGSFKPEGSFVNQNIGTYYEMAALAALGFVVVGILGRGTAIRDKHFQDHKFGTPGYEDDLNDHIAGMRQLAKTYPYMDLDRVGITCWEGTVNVVYASLNHSDFYKVTVSHCFGDPRFCSTPFEMFDGIVNKEMLSKVGGPEDCVKSFSGKLLLIHGVMTSGAEPMFRLVDALQKANKDFDMLILPNLMAQMTGYTRRRGWDYLVTHLQNIQPPSGFKLTTGEELLLEKSGYGPGAAEIAMSLVENNSL